VLKILLVLLTTQQPCIESRTYRGPELGRVIELTGEDDELAAIVRRIYTGTPDEDLYQVVVLSYWRIEEDAPHRFRVSEGIWSDLPWQAADGEPYAISVPAGARERAVQLGDFEFIFREHADGTEFMMLDAGEDYQFQVCREF
jgi:hypothetical protein